MASFDFTIPSRLFTNILAIAYDFSTGHCWHSREKMTDADWSVSDSKFSFWQRIRNLFDFDVRQLETFQNDPPEQILGK